MTTHIIELNDSDLRLSQGGQRLQESPGFALIEASALQTGAAARSQARLHPLQTNNQFWQRLNLEPLANANAHCRHHADLAFNHLQELQRLAQEQGTPIADVIYAVPGNFSRDQLALLLGITQACEFNAVGLVDSATAALAPRVGPGRYLHVDLQLHQCVITHLNAGAELERGQAETLTGAGLLNCYDSWAHLAATQFIQQTRFDPFHNASSEQALFDQLPDVLTQCASTGEAVLTLQSHKITLSLAQLEQSLEAIRDRITQKLQQPGIDRIFFSDRWQHLPGFATLLAKGELLPTDAIAAAAEAHSLALRSDAEALSLVTQLPAGGTNASAASPASAEKPEQSQAIASHLLCGHRAFPTRAPLYIVDHQTQGALDLAHSPGSHPLCAVTPTAGQLELRAINGSGLTLNDRPARNGDQLQPGDRLGLPGVGEQITAIKVIDADGP